MLTRCKVTPLWSTFIKNRLCMFSPLTTAPVMQLLETLERPRSCPATRHSGDCGGVKGPFQEFCTCNLDFLMFKELKRHQNCQLLWRSVNCSNNFFKQNWKTLLVPAPRVHCEYCNFNKSDISTYDWLWICCLVRWRCRRYASCSHLCKCSLSGPESSHGRHGGRTRPTLTARAVPLSDVTRSNSSVLSKSSSFHRVPVWLWCVVTEAVSLQCWFVDITYNGPLYWFLSGASITHMQAAGLWVKGPRCPNQWRCSRLNVRTC